MAHVAQDHTKESGLADRLARIEQELEHGTAQLRERHTHYRTALSQVKSARSDASDRSWELADLEQRQRELRAQREGPGDQLLERELSSIASQRALLEEQVLALLLSVDELAAHAQAAEHGLAAEEAAWRVHAAALHAERDRTAALLKSPSPNRRTPRSG